MKISSENKVDLISKLVRFMFIFQQHLTKIKEVNKKELNPCIYAMWHANQCCIFGQKDKANLNVLVSRSIDGEIIARNTIKLGFQVVRGSKGKKGSVEATMQLIEKLKKGENIAIMVDGPSGPALKVKEGVVKIAKLSGAPIVPVTWYSDFPNFLRLPSWDKFTYPLGYTKLVNLYGEPIYVSPDNTDEQDEQIRQQLEDVLNELDKQAPEVYKEVHKFRLWKKKEKI